MVFLVFYYGTEFEKLGFILSVAYFVFMIYFVVQLVMNDGQPLNMPMRVFGFAVTVCPLQSFFAGRISFFTSDESSIVFSLPLLISAFYSTHVIGMICFILLCIVSVIGCIRAIVELWL